MAELVRDECRKILNFSPEILIEDAGKKEISKELFVETDKLKTFGISLVDDSVSEIDKLLIFCKANF
jgi:hypothetical protein